MKTECNKCGGGTGQEHACNCAANFIRDNVLTEREKWLMREAFEKAMIYVDFDIWLEDLAADGGITVEMVLAKDAPK